MKQCYEIKKQIDTNLIKKRMNALIILNEKCVLYNL